MIKNAGENDIQKSSPKSGNKGGRPRGVKNKPKPELLQELIETKLTLAELALEQLKLRLRHTTDKEEREKILRFVDEMVEKIKQDL
jgi:hypothetical protein